MKTQNQIGGFLDKIPCDIIVELAHFYLNSDDYKSLRIMNKYLKRCLKEEAKIKGTNIKSVKQEREKRDRELVKRDPYEIVNIHNPSKSVQSIALDKLIVLHKLHNTDDNKTDVKTRIIINNFNKIEEFYKNTIRPEEMHKTFGDNISFKTQEIMSRESPEETKKKASDRKKIYKILEKFIEDVDKQNKLFLSNTISVEDKLISLNDTDKLKMVKQIQSRIRNLEPYLPILNKISPKIKSKFIFSLLKKQHKTNLNLYDIRLKIMNNLKTMMRSTKQGINQDQIDEKISSSKKQVKRIHTEYDPQMNKNRPKIIKAVPEKLRKKTKMKTKMTIKPPIKPTLNRVEQYNERQRWLAERRETENYRKRPREKTREKTKEKKRPNIMLLPQNDN